MIREYAPGWYGDLSLSSSGMLRGTVVCFYPETFGRAKEDMFVRICRLPILVRHTQTLVTVSGETVRISKGQNESFIELKVFKKCRPCRSIYLCCLLQHPRWVVLGAEVGHLQLSGERQTGTVQKRSQKELEFIAPTVDGSDVVRTCVYPDGRMVVDSDQSVCLNSVVYAASPGEGGRLEFSKFAKQVVGSEITVHQDQDLVLLQGKVLVDPSGEDTEIQIANIPLDIAPGTTERFLIGHQLCKKDFESRTAELIISVDGKVTVRFFQPITIVQMVSLSGVCWSILKPPDRSAQWVSCLAIPFPSDCVAEGISDFLSLENLSTKFDLNRFKLNMLDKRMSVNPPSRSQLGGWAHKLVSRYPPRGPRIDAQAEYACMRISRQRYSEISCTMSNLRKFLAGLSKGKERVVVDKVRRPMLLTEAVSGKSLIQARIQALLMGGSRKCKHQIEVMKRASVDELEKLAEIVAWWNQWSTSGKYLSHSSLMGNQDIFTETGKWAIPDDPETQRTLFNSMAWIYRKGYDTFISEIQTPLFPLIEDLDMESTVLMEDTVAMDRMFLDDSLTFIKERARALHMLYPTRSEFTVYIYSSSGFNKSKGKWKSSFHLVWPDVIVNGELAPIIRQTTVEYFVYKSATTRYFGEMQKRLVNHYEANIWENVFDQTTSNANNGLRMPFCNKASWIKNEFGGKSPNVENRRCYPKGAIKIRFQPTEFESVSAEQSARTEAIRLISFVNNQIGEKMHDQNKLVGDRTQYKQADKNTVNRTSAFMAGMKSQGGDLRAFFSIEAEWVQRVTDPLSLSDEEVAVWIQRGSCRRLNAELSEYNHDFVDCYLKADLQWFHGLTLEDLRETELYKKLTPAGQQGLKIRFRKYQQSLVGGGVVAGKTSTDDVARLHALAQRVKDTPKLLAPATVSTITPTTDDNDDEDDKESVCSLPPEDAGDNFDLWHESLANVFSFHGPLYEWQNRFSNVLNQVGIGGGYWIGGSHALIWISPRIDATSDGYSSCIRAVRNARAQVSVSLYYHCGKIVVSGDKRSPQYATVLSLVRESAAPDDRLYHKLIVRESQDAHEMLSSFPLIDKAGARAQRAEYEQRWGIMENMASDTSTVDLETR